jgi:hypothetical protein
VRKVRGAGQGRSTIVCWLQVGRRGRRDVPVPRHIRCKVHKVQYQCRGRRRVVGPQESHRFARQSSSLATVLRGNANGQIENVSRKNRSQLLTRNVSCPIKAACRALVFRGRIGKGACTTPFRVVVWKGDEYIEQMRIYYGWKYLLFFSAW